jgi:Tfp pilus assembly protein FimT
MAASKSIREALNTLNDELLTAKLTAVAFNNLHADIEASPPPSTIRMLGSSWWCRWSTAWNGRPALEQFLRQRHCQCLKTWKRHPVEVSRGLVEPPVSPARAFAEEGYPTGPTLKTTSGAMVAKSSAFFACTARCAASPILPRHQDLNFSSRLTPPWSAHIIQVP